jgi:hypothetical protein
MKRRSLAHPLSRKLPRAVARGLLAVKRSNPSFEPIATGVTGVCGSTHTLDRSSKAMVTIKFLEFLDAFDFASYSGPGESRAFINLDTGALHCISDAIEPEEELPEDLDSSDRYLALPHKNDLDLGRQLALSFTEQYLANEYDRVVGYFHKRGAYSRFKDLLEHRGVLETWYTYEKLATERALRQWCADHEIQLSFSDPAV